MSQGSQRNAFFCVRRACICQFLAVQYTAVTMNRAKSGFGD